MIIRHLSYVGPVVDTASIDFSDGLNIITGPSNTGKSFILDSIDFIFGRTRLTDALPEREAYTHVLLGIETADEKTYTIVRSPLGGGVVLYSGLHREVPEKNQRGDILVKSVSSTSDLSNFMMRLMGMTEIKLKKNKQNVTKRLTLRTLMPLSIIDESQIQTKGSPYIGVQHVNKTYDRSRLRYLLTGADDSGLVAEENSNVVLRRATRIKVFEELKEEKVSELARYRPNDEPIKEFRKQRKKLKKRLKAAKERLSGDESAYRSVKVLSMRQLDEIEETESRLAEIDSMVSRFELLRDQYASDLLRLDANLEAGSFLSLLPDQECPICGSKPGERTASHAEHGNLDVTLIAIKAEHSKILLLSGDLKKLIFELREEFSTLNVELGKKSEKFETLENKVRELSIPLKDGRRSFRKLLTAKTNVEQILSLFDEVDNLEQRVHRLREDKPDLGTNEPDSSLPTYSLDNLSKIFENLIQDWGIVKTARVHFDTESGDFVIDGKKRSANGKGFRAVTYAAAILALKTATKQTGLLGAGFTLLDSPLLAYEKPDDTDEDAQIAGSDSNRRFFESLQKMNHQIIVFENNKSLPDNIPVKATYVKFSGLADSGRFGFFPENLL